MLRKRIITLFVLLACFAAAYFLLDVFVMGVRIRYHLTGPIPDIERISRRFHTVFVLAAAALVAFNRILIHHPQFKPAYRQWLVTMPWTAGVPLPLGPITATWSDAVFISALTGIGWWHSNASPLQIVIVYLMSYVLAASIALCATVQRSVFLLAFGGAVIIWLLPRWTATLAVASILFLVGNLLVRRSLWAFPWTELKRITTNVGLGNPFQQLSPAPPKHSLPVSEGLLLSALVGCWAFAVTSHFPLELKESDVMFFIITLGLIGPIARCGAYLSQVGAPISFLGRFFTGRIIIPGFDKVFVAPLCAMLVLTIVPEVLQHRDVAWPIWIGITMAMYVASLLCIGPTLADWNLTSVSRVRRMGSVQTHIRN